MRSKQPQISEKRRKGQASPELPILTFGGFLGGFDQRVGLDEGEVGAIHVLGVRRR